MPFSAYPFATWLPGGADGSTTGTPEVDRPTLVVGNHLLTGKVKFHDDGSTIPGHESGDIIRQTLIPNLSYVYPLGDGLNLNLAMSATSGTATNYHRNWGGRYFGIDTSIAVIEVLPSISYRLSDTLAVGAGLMIDYAEMKTRQKLPTAAFGRDTKLQMKGDDVGIGFTLGVVWRPWEGTTFGLGYRSRSTYELELDAKFYNIPPHDGGRPGHGHPLQGPRHHEVDVPQNVNFGVQQKITDKLTLMADITWTQWSIMKEMTTVFQRGPLVTKNTQVMKWHDSWRFSFGGEYKLSDK